MSLCHIFRSFYRASEWSSRKCTAWWPGGRIEAMWTSRPSQQTHAPTLHALRYATQHDTTWHDKLLLHLQITFTSHLHHFHIYMFAFYIHCILPHDTSLPCIAMGTSVLHRGGQNPMWHSRGGRSPSWDGVRVMGSQRFLWKMLVILDIYVINPWNLWYLINFVNQKNLDRLTLKSWFSRSILNLIDGSDVLGWEWSTWMNTHITTLYNIYILVEHENRVLT